MKKLLNLVKSRSLKQIYLNFTLAIIIASIFLAVWIAWSTFQEYEQESELQLRKAGNQVLAEFQNRLNYAEHLLFYLATKISERPRANLEEIAFFIKQSHQERWSNIRSWTMINYIDTEGILVVDSTDGVKKKPLKAESRFQLLQLTAENPWHIYFGASDYGLTSKKRIIPMGVGITDINEHFIGMLYLGINVDKLINSIANELDDTLDFLTLDGQLQLIYDEDGGEDKDLLNHQLIQAIGWHDSKATNFNELKTTIISNEYIYSHVITSNLYPFHFIIGQSELNYYQNLKQGLLQRILGKILLGMGFIAVLLTLSYKVVRPIIELSDAASNISSSTNSLDLRQTYGVDELDALASQLMRVSRITKDLRYKQAQLTKTNNRLAHANSFIKSNMSFMSHELKNPIAAIIEFSKYTLDHFKNTSTSQEIISTLEMIHQAATYQNKQIAFFLRLFSFQEQGKTLELRNINLAEIIHWSLSMTQYLAKQKRISITAEIEDDLPELIGDEVMISQMIQNLAINAIKYNIHGGKLTIKAYTRYNTLRKRELILEFNDTGIGIAAKDLKLIFQRFSRIQNEATAQVIGYGVGLAYVKNCIVAHDGEINVKSAVDKGTSFTIIFPHTRIRLANFIYLKSNQ